MDHYHYQDSFKKLYDKAAELYAAGNRDRTTYFDDDEEAFIKANGWRRQDFYDYAEDKVTSDQPSYEIAQSIEQVRRDYFLHIQDGIASDKRITEESLPPKKEEIDGIVWLPRILPKARGKLKGELPTEIMYCCGGDRRFLRDHNIHPAEFLRVVWANMDDDAAILAFVKKRAAALATA